LHDLPKDASELVNRSKSHWIEKLKLQVASRNLLKQRPLAGATSVEPDIETKRQLEALGYITE
jgi:hypothetical protein